eukprot:SAG31_NODE_885_length_11254_cov_14.613088_4_plen_396_part_00
MRSVATPSAPGDCQCFSTAGQHSQINFLVTSMQTATHPVSLAHESNCAHQIPAFQNVAPCLVLCVTVCFYVCVRVCTAIVAPLSVLLSLSLVSYVSVFLLPLCLLLCSCSLSIDDLCLFSLCDALSLLCVTVFSLFYFPVSACVSLPSCPYLVLRRVSCSFLVSAVIVCRPGYALLCLLSLVSLPAAPAALLMCLSARACVLCSLLSACCLCSMPPLLFSGSLCVCCCPVLALLSVSLPLAFLPLYSVSALSPLLVFSCSNYYFSSLPGLLFSLFVLYSAAGVCCGLSSVFSTLSSLLLPAFSLAARACLRLLSLSLPSLPAVMCLPLPVHLLQRPVTPSGFCVFVQTPERHRILAPANLEEAMRAVSSKAKCGCSAAEQHSMSNILVTSTRTST